MKIDNIKLIVCDVDGTLLPNKQDTLSRPTVRALHRAVENGYRVMICTGRHYTLIPPSFFKDLDMEVIGTINGACLVRRDGSVIEKHPMSLEDMEGITRICRENGIGLGFKFEDAIVTYANYDKFMKGYARGPHDYEVILNDDASRTHHLKHGCPLGTFIIGDESVIAPFAETMPDLVFAWSMRNGFDVFLKSITKATSVERVLKDNHWSWDNVIAFGDAGNDTPMLERAAIGVAMGNSKDNVRDVADLVADTCERDGVAKMLNELGFTE